LPGFSDLNLGGPGGRFRGHRSKGQQTVKAGPRKGVQEKTPASVWSVEGMMGGEEL